MICPKCKSELADNSKFCTHCGTKLEKPAEAAPVQEEEKKPVCIKCGAELKPGAKFCAKCGTKQEEAPAAAEPAAPKAEQPVKTEPAAKAGSSIDVDKNKTPKFVQPASKEEKPVTEDKNKTPKPVQPEFKPVQPAAKPVQPESRPVQPAAKSAQPTAKPVQPAAKPAQPAAKPVQPAAKPKKKAPVGLIVLLILLLLLIGGIVGGCIVLDKVYGVNPIEMLTDLGGKEKDDTDDKESGKDKEGTDKDQDGAEKGDPALLDAVDEVVEAAKKAADEGSYEDAIQKGLDAIQQYVTIAEENQLSVEAEDKIQDAYKIVSEAAITYCKGIEEQEAGSAGYEQVVNTVEPIMETTAVLEEKGYIVDADDLKEYQDGIVLRFKNVYIRKINEITEREQWSRDEAWTYADQAYSIQKDGKTVLFDENDLDDPLRLRYAYCLARISQKRCEKGVADSSMTKEDAFNAMVAVLEETDYNLLVLQDAIAYGSAAGKDVAKYQNAYNAIVDHIKTEQNLSILNSGVNSGTTVDVKSFWYFNDLDGEEGYKVDIHNGTTKATREWIRNNVPSYLN